MLGEVVGIDNSWDDIEAGQAWKDLGKGMFEGDAVYNEPLMGGMLGSHTIDDPEWYDYVGAGLLGAMQGLSFGGGAAAARGVRAVGKKRLRDAGKVARESGEAAMGRGVTSATKDATGEMRRLLSSSSGKGLPEKGSTIMTTTGPKINPWWNPKRYTRFADRAEVGSPAKYFQPRINNKIASQKDIKAALDLVDSGKFKTLDEAMEALRLIRVPGQKGQLAAHGMERLSRFNPSAIGSGSRRIKVGSTLDEMGQVKRPWYRGTPKSDLGKWGIRGRKLDMLRRLGLGGHQWVGQEGITWPFGGDLGGPPVDLTDLGTSSGDLASHSGYTSNVGFGGGQDYLSGTGLGGQTGLGGTSSGFGDYDSMGNIASQSSIGTAHQPIWAGTEWGSKYGVPIATGENMRIGERLLKEAEEKMNEKSGSKKPAHGMVIVIGSKAGPGPSTEGKRDKVDSEKKDD
jgi:hypothetical protein